MDYKEFKGISFHTEKSLIIPILGNIKIDKTIFIDKKGKYSFKKEEEYLREYYEKIKNKIKE